MNTGTRSLWTGQRYDATVGLYSFRARSYDPRLGQWLQRDPLGYIDGVNLRQYVRSGPTRFVDPLGLAPGWPFTDACGEGDGPMPPGWVCVGWECIYVGDRPPIELGEEGEPTPEHVACVWTGCGDGEEPDGGWIGGFPAALVEIVVSDDPSDPGRLATLDEMRDMLPGDGAEAPWWAGGSDVPILDPGWAQDAVLWAAEVAQWLAPAKQAGKKSVVAAVDKAQDAASDLVMWFSKRNPSQSTPFNVLKRNSSRDGKPTYTTYDQHGRRHREYKFNDADHGPHQHNYSHGPTRTEIRSGARPIDEP